MNKNRNNTFILILFIIVFRIHSQNDDSVSCQVYLDPILDFDLIIGDDKKELFANFAKYEKVEPNKLKHISEDIIPYEALKFIKLPNGYQTKVRFYLQFKNDKLSTYNLKFVIGEDYKYFWELIEYLKKYDKNNINSFLYDSIENKASYIDVSNESCKRIFSVGRGHDDNTKFEITCKVN